MAGETREAAFGLLIALAAIRVLQSKSVLGKRGESPAVRGDGDEGRELAAEPGADPGELVALSIRTLDFLEGAADSCFPEVLAAGETAREDT